MDGIGDNGRGTARLRAQSGVAGCNLVAAR
jgi:hypothetical protein